MQLRVKIKPREKGETRSRANTFWNRSYLLFRYLLTGVCQFSSYAIKQGICHTVNSCQIASTHIWAHSTAGSLVLLFAWTSCLPGFAFVLYKSYGGTEETSCLFGSGFKFCRVSGYWPLIDLYLWSQPKGKQHVTFVVWSSQFRKHHLCTVP